MIEIVILDKNERGNRDGNIREYFSCGAGGECWF